MAGKNKDELKSLSTNAVRRGLSLVNLTLSSGARFAKWKIEDAFASGDKGKLSQKFLTKQARVLVSELGKLKGSIMKAGQMLSVYGEHFFPEEVNNILKTLQADSRPVIWSEMEQVLRSQLGAKLDELEIDPRPIAAASMGQVYAARQKSSGDKLAIKVQYPGVDRAIDSDLKTLKKILRLSQLFPGSERFDEIFKEVRMILHYEVDYTRELDQIRAYRDYLRDDRRFVLPEVYPQYSTSRVLTMSYEDGLAVDSPEVRSLSQVERNHIGVGVMELMFREIFEWRLVQTDPHLGNYKIRLHRDALPQVVLFDFGAVRKFPKRYISPFRDLALGAVMHDDDAVINAGIQMGFIRTDDSEEHLALFAEICLTAVEGFDEDYASPSLDGSEAGGYPYDWKDNDLIERLSALAKDAVFTFKLRPPPREAIFLDRKMAGVHTLLSTLRVKFGPRDLILKYLRLPQ